MALHLSPKFALLRSRIGRDLADRSERNRVRRLDWPPQREEGGTATCQCTAPARISSGTEASPDTCSACGLPTGSGGVIYGSSPATGPRNRRERRAAAKRGNR